MGNSYGNRSIVLDDLRFNSDPANKQSYPGSGTKFYDTISIEGSSNQDAFGDIDGATFDTGNAGFFEYDGVNDYVVYNEGIEIPEGTNQITMDVWFNSQDSEVRTIFCYLNGNSDIIFQLIRTDNAGQLAYRWYNEELFEENYSEIIDEEGTWFNITVAHEGSQVNLFRNGEIFATRNVGASFNLDDPGKFYIGTQNGSDRFWKGGISCFKFYSNILSGTEVRQNYNALKHRF